MQIDKEFQSLTPPPTPAELAELEADDDSLIRHYVQYRKSAELRLIAQVAVLFGTTCFFANRGLGECSGDVALGRIVPGSHGGEYTVENCHITCDRHNRERGDRTIGDYMMQCRAKEV